MEPLYGTFKIISVPADRQALQKVTDATKSAANTFKMDIPELKVGTLDSLMQISDELGKHDSFLEGASVKLANNISVLLERDSKLLESSLTANGTSVPSYLRDFRWNEAKYPTKNSIRDLVDTIVKQVNEIDTEMKVKMGQYNNLKTSLSNMERKQNGNLLVRSLNDLVSKENFILESEFLVTLLVVVPKHGYKEWTSTYETLCAKVVPRSSQKLHEDKEYGLFSVVVFKVVANDFKQAARDKKFIVRDFEFKQEEIDLEREERSQLSTDMKKQLTSLTRWCKAHFSEVFEAWIHLKALRVYVESVLRYGLPPKFQAAIMELTTKNEKRLHGPLKEAFGHLGAGSDDADEADYHPYVFFHINLDNIR